MTGQRGLLFCVITAVMALPLAAQGPRPAFEVASIKKLAQRVPFTPNRTPPGSPAFYATNATVASLIQLAHNVNDFEVIGGPGWIRQDLFEINAKAAGEASDDEKRLMLQSLLEARFGLVMHREQRAMRFMALVVADRDGRLGPDLTGCEESAPPPKPILWPRGGRVSAVPCSPVAVIAGLASRILKTSVVDRTGLTGMWRHQLVFADPDLPAAGAGGAAPLVDPNLPSFTTALQEQLGLRVEQSRGPVDVLVIDSVQQPTDN